MSPPSNAKQINETKAVNVKKEEEKIPDISLKLDVVNPTEIKKINEVRKMKMKTLKAKEVS